jgi:hypothetical protein
MNPLLPFVLLGLGLGYADYEVSKFERLAAAEISSQLGGEDRKVTVTAVPSGLSLAWGELESAQIDAEGFTLRELPFFTEPWRSKAGKLGMLRMRMRDFNLRGLQIAELSADIPNCRYDLGLARGKKQFRISKSGEGTGSVRVDEKALAEYIVEKYAEVKSATVRIYNDVVWVEGYGEFLIVNTNFTVIAKLTPVDGTKLVLTDAKIYFDWTRAEPAAAQVLLDLLNPVVDLYSGLGLYDAISVTDVRLRDGFVLASGKTRVPLKPGAPASR